MAPQKASKPVIPMLVKRTSSLKTRTTTTSINREPRVKRKADCSPSKETAVKRSAFCDVTNAITKVKLIDNKCKKPTKVTVQAKIVPSIKTVRITKHNENIPPQAPVPRIQTRAAARSSLAPDTNSTVQKPKEGAKETLNAHKVKTRLSNEFEKTEESLYCTALEDINESSANASAKKLVAKAQGSNEKPVNVSFVAEQIKSHLNLGNHEVPENICDFDKENWDDTFQVSHYAMDIFNYLKTREPLFVAKDYMDRQICLTRWMRSLLVDWMVEIQESFELNHETLYLGVKLVDLYLSKMTVSKETLQLVGAASMFIASKYDERIPPLVDDFLYICDGAYSRRELLRMEMNVLKVIDFNLGIPISYRFLRRYARCAKVTMPILTLARYVLELALMDYTIVTISDSKLAAAALYLALRMKNVSKWTRTLEFYTGYKLEQLKTTIRVLNDGLHRKPVDQLKTVRNKYSHKIFFEVAKTPLLTNEELD